MKKIIKILNRILDALAAGQAYTTGGDPMLRWYLDQKEAA